MYARIRQKLAIANNTTVINTTSLGNIASSLLMKDIGRLITGQITSTAQLNQQIWDADNSEIVNTVAAGWSEYQSNLLNTSTNFHISANYSTDNMIYMRCPSQTPSTTGGTVYKYAGIGPTQVDNTASTLNVVWNMKIPWSVTDWTGNPTVSFRHLFAQSALLGRNPFSIDVFYEYIIYVTPRCLLISNRRIGTTPSSAISKVYMQLEHLPTPLNQFYNLPNQIIWEVGQHASTSTGTGANFISTGYQTTNGYSQGDNSDILTGSTVNVNLAFVYTRYPTAPNLGWTSLWSTAAGTAETSTLKPSTYGSMSNTLDNSGNIISVPAMPLLHFPPWDTVYDMSSLTGIYATRPGLGASGDTLTVNGAPYAYLNATTMSYLIPMQ